MRRMIDPVRLVALGVLLALVAAGCGGGADVVIEQVGAPVDDGVTELPSPEVDPEPEADADPDHVDAVEKFNQVDDQLSFDDPPDIETADDLPDEEIVDDGHGEGPVGMSDGSVLVFEAALTPVTTAIEMVLTMEMGGLADLGSEPISFSVTAAAAADGSASRFVMDLGGFMEAAAEAEGEPLPPELAAVFGEPIEIREIGDTVYMSSSFFSWLVPVDTAWLSFPADDSSGIESIDTGSIEPLQFLTVLQAFGVDASIVGTELIDYVETTHFRGHLTAADLAAMGEDEFLEGLDPTGMGLLDVAAVDLDVWVTAYRQVRRMQLGIDDLAAIDPTAAPGAYFLFTIDLAPWSVGSSSRFRRPRM